MRTNFLSAFVNLICSHSFGLGGRGGNTGGGFNKSYELILSMHVRVVWSIMIALCSSQGNLRIIGTQRPGVMRALTDHEVHVHSKEMRDSLT